MSDVVFTKEMKRTHTIIIPNMAPVHFSILKEIFQNHGFKVKLLENSGPEVIQMGLKYVHNDMCYPALLVIGQILDALEKGIVDRSHAAIAITQTGGGCRASNYYNLLKKALERAGMGDIPVISLNLKGMNSNPGFRITPIMMLQAYSAIIYGDLLMVMANQTRPYEINRGDTDKVLGKWVNILKERYENNHGYFWKHMKTNMNAISDDFASVPVKREPKVKVGVVGEIYMKFSPLGNSNLEQFLRDEGCEVMLPPLDGFLMYGFSNQIQDRKYYGRSLLFSFISKHLLLPYMEKYDNRIAEAMSRHPEYHAPASFSELLSYAGNYVDRGCKMGEGWLLTSEMEELIRHGYENIVCTQPFGCLPNHIVGKGMIRPLKVAYPESNIVAIDYDPSASRVNQENRLKLMLSVARENLEKRSLS